MCVLLDDVTQPHCCDSVDTNVHIHIDIIIKMYSECKSLNTRFKYYHATPLVTMYTVLFIRDKKFLVGRDGEKFIRTIYYRNTRDIPNIENQNMALDFANWGIENTIE